MNRTILHSDCNCFYASVELLHHPELRGKPVAVGGDPEARHGIVLTADYTAKRYGVKTGMALWQAKQLCPDITFLPPRMDLYLRFSRMAQEIYADYTDKREPYGIDESWLDATDNATLKGDGFHIAQEISSRMKKELGITVSVGVSFNKIFAKLGSDYKKPDAITTMYEDEFQRKAWCLPVSDLLYVGNATNKKLYSMGIRTIGDLAKSDETLLVRKLGKMGSILWAFANGYDESPVKLENTSAPVKSVGNSTTTPRDMETDEDVRIVLYILAESVAARLRENGFRCRTVEISVRDKELFHMWLLRELLNNCIAHSEYTLGGRIYLNEFEDKIILTNPGSFLPGKIEKVLDPGYNPPFYRNQLLAETMVKLNMIDSQSIGIRRVFRIQRDRYFPLPDYDLSNRQQVKVCVYGKVLDENYSQILFANPDFDLETVFLIDCVQKRIKIDKEAVKHLRKLKVIEGMSPNIFLSASVSETIGEQSQYVKNKAFNDQYYRDLIVKYLEQYGSAKKRDVRELLWDKLPEVMDDKQKESKVKNLLAKMRRMGIITTDSENQQKSSWILVKDLNKQEANFIQDLSKLMRKNL